jgi:hypothetical protein
MHVFLPGRQANIKLWVSQPRAGGAKFKRCVNIWESAPPQFDCHWSSLIVTCMTSLNHPPDEVRIAVFVSCHVD